MTWIKSDSELSRSRKFYDLANRLNVSPVNAFWNLHHLWYWCSDQFPDGVMKDVSDLAIAHSAQWSGEPKTFVEALVISGFIDREPGQLRVHDWDQWKADPARLKEKRQTSDKRPTNVGSAQESLVVLLSFPVSGKTKTWLLGEDKVKEWSETYPGVDVISECKKALQWIKDNPTRQKTFTGMPRFLNSWLSRCQNSSYGKSEFSRKYINQPPIDPDEMHVIKGWKFLNSIPIKGPESDAWDSVHAQRYATAARSLLTLFGPWDSAVDAMEYIYMSLKSKKLSCTMDTIVKHSDLYREYKAGRVTV